MHTVKKETKRGGTNVATKRKRKRKRIEITLKIIIIIIVIIPRVRTQHVYIRHQIFS